jgi:hypothetical protein
MIVTALPRLGFLSISSSFVVAFERVASWPSAKEVRRRRNT